MNSSFDDVPLLIFSNTKHDSDLRYLVGCCVPDDIALIFDGKETIVLASALEVGRLKRLSKIDNVFNLENFRTKNSDSSEEYITILSNFLKNLGIVNVVVKKNCQIWIVNGLSENGINVKVGNFTMLPQRLIKSENEVDEIRKCAAIVEKVFQEVRDAIASSSIGSDGELILDGELLTSERLRKFMEDRSYALGAVAEDTIVSCGDDACDPHNIGHGTIYANQPIVIDFFPYLRNSGYFSDVTRTFLKGRPSNKQKKLYDAVKSAHDMAINMVCDSASSDSITSKVINFFKNIGFKTNTRSSNPSGMFHSLGHGIGLDIHERPKVGFNGDILKSGMTITIEPGLYYRGIGGVRIEDDLLVKADCHELLTNMPYEFAIE